MHQLGHHILALLALRRISELRSINSAAHALNISQSALSRSVARLEAALGVPVLVRSRQGVDLTPFGKAVLIHIRAIESSLNAMLTDSATLSGTKALILRLGAGPLVLNYFLPPVIEALQQTYGGMAIRMVEAPRLQLLAQLRSGELDVVIATFPMDRQETGLIQKEIFDIDLRIVARSQHPLAGCKRRMLRELALFRWVLPPADTSFARRIERDFRRAGVPFLLSTIEASSPEAVRSLVKSADIIGIMPLRSIIQELNDGVFVAFEGDWTFERRKVGMFLREGEPIPSACRILVQSLRQSSTPRHAARVKA